MSGVLLQTAPQDPQRWRELQKKQRLPLTVVSMDSKRVQQERQQRRTFGERLTTWSDMQDARAGKLVPRKQSKSDELDMTG